MKLDRVEATNWRRMWDLNQNYLKSPTKAAQRTCQLWNYFHKKNYFLLARLWKPWWQTSGHTEVWEKEVTKTAKDAGLYSNSYGKISSLFTCNTKIFDVKKKTSLDAQTENN